MVNIKIDTNAAALSDRLAAIASGQMPFVMAQTLTQMAQMARKAQKDRLGEYFKQRTNWSKTGLKVIRAEKKDFPNPFAIVGVRDKIMALNITGGDRGSTGSGSVAVPNQESRKFLNSSNETLGPPRFPGRIVKRKFNQNKPFIIDNGSKSRMVIRTSNERYPLLTLYIFKDKVRIDKNWPLVENVNRQLSSIYSETFSENLKKALK